MKTALALPDDEPARKSARPRYLLACPVCEADWIDDETHGECLACGYSGKPKRVRI